MKKIITSFFILPLFIGTANSKSINPIRIEQSVKHISCIKNSDKNNEGTGFFIDKNTFVSASHVISNKNCEIRDFPRYPQILVNNQKLDFSLIKTYDKNNTYLKISCSGFISGEKYQSFGYIAGEMYIFKLKARPSFYTFKDKTTEHLRVLEGTIFKGMSGGPIIDKNGVVVGINIAIGTQSSNDSISKKIPVVLSRELKDTPLCNI